MALSTRKMTIAATVTVAVAAVLAVTAIGEDGEEKKTPPAEAAWTLPDKPDPDVRAVVSALFDGNTRRAAAQEELIYRCMALRGFSYIKPPPPITMRIPQNYGLSVAEATRHGYRIQLKKPPKINSPIDQTAGLSAEGKKAWGVALRGGEDGPVVHVAIPGGVVEEPADGCLAAARTRIYGSLPQQVRLQNLAGHLTPMAQKRSAADPEMARLNQTWSGCMEAKGHHGLKTPEDARGEALEFHRGYIRLTHAEIRLAVADAGCERVSGYARKRRLLEDRYYTAGVHYFGGGVNELRAASDRSFREAQRILQGTG